MNNKLFNIAIAATLITSSAATLAPNKAMADQGGKGITVSIENATIQTPQLLDPSEYFVVDFNDQDGMGAFSKTNGNTTYSYSKDLEVKTANQWGGANGSNFITQAKLASIRSYSLNVSQDQKYFGFWWSAGDAYNQITFKDDGKIVAAFNTADLVNFIKNNADIDASAYYGNPAYSGAETGHDGEPFAFVNVFFDQESYDEVVVATLTEGGSAFESDNHTFSAKKQPPRGSKLPNLAPIANDDSATTSIYNTITIDVLGNDTDPDNDKLFLLEVSDAFSGGEATIVDNKIVYTAGSVPGEFGMSYTMKDEYGATTTGKVDLTVTASPD